MAQTRTEIQNRYDAKNCKHYSLKLNVTTDADIIGKLSSVNGVQAYIKQAIRAYMAMDSHSVPVSAPKSASCSKYHIKPEYLHLWGSDVTEETVIDDADIRMFSADWDKTEDELLEQLIPID